MFSKLLNNFTTKLYIEISDKYIKVINLKTGITYEDQPLIAIDYNEKGEETILAIGKEASLHPNAINPFSHPRVIMDNYKMAELILRYVFKKAAQKNIFSPIAIIKIMRKFDTPLCDIEKRVLCDLSANAGARETIILDDINLDIYSIEYEKLRENAFCCEERIKAWS